MAEVGLLLLVPIAAQAGDASRGREIFESRQTGLCILCHAGPASDPALTGNLAPDLSGVGSRLSPADLRRHLATPTAFNPETIMPPYARILSKGQIDDVVAYLQSLR